MIKNLIEIERYFYEMGVKDFKKDKQADVAIKKVKGNEKRLNLTSRVHSKLDSHFCGTIEELSSPQIYGGMKHFANLFCQGYNSQFKTKVKKF